MLENLLGRLGLDRSEIKTYITLLETGPVPVGALAKKGGINRVTQYVIVDRMLEKGFITQSLRGGVKIFTPLEPDKLVAVYEEKLLGLETDYENFKKMLPGLKSKNPERLLTPKFQIFEGVDGLKFVLKDMLLYKNLQTQAYWPIKKMIEVLSGDFFRYHNKERIKNNIFTRAIWPSNQTVELKKYPYLGIGEKFKREIRVAPAIIDFTMGYWIYGNKVALLSSQKENFGFIIESSEFAEMLLSQFEVIWKMSKAFVINAKESEIFLREISS